jgi:hypothetical protein
VRGAEKLVRDAGDHASQARIAGDQALGAIWIVSLEPGMRNSETGVGAELLLGPCCS